MSERQPAPPTYPAASSDKPRTTRRKVLKVAAVAAAGAAVGFAAPATLNRVLFGGHSRQWRFLTANEASLLDAVCAQIIPTDQDPGAREAGCVVYIDCQLAGPLQRLFRSDGIIRANRNHAESNCWSKFRSQRSTTFSRGRTFMDPRRPTPKQSNAVASFDS